MSIDLKLFGDLRKKADPKILGTLSLRLKINDSEITWITDILRKFKIEEDEVSHIFVNGRYSGLKKKVASGDKVSLFPRNMGLLYKWYFKREEDEE
jgi:molybdopterin converting factor small subunit